MTPTTPNWQQYPFDSMSTSLKTIQDYLRWTVSLFNQADLSYGHGTDNSWDEATCLVLTALHLPVDCDRSILGACVLPAEAKQIIEWVKERLIHRKPLPYLTHQAWLGGLSFFVNEHVLIPRSPIAELIDQAFEPWIDPEQVETVLDLCTGSGSLAILTASTLLEASVDAVDISPEALIVAKQNVDRHYLGDRLHLIESDLFTKLKGKKYDLILSNPPYVSDEEYQQLPKEYSYEPILALKAEQQGLAIVARLLKEAVDYLNPTGILVVEVGSLQPTVESHFPEYPFTWLQFENGGEGVFLLTAQELKEVKR